MNFNYSYSAFLLTSLILGCLILILYSIKIKSAQPKNEEITYDIALAEESLLLEEEQTEALAEKVEIETNKAYNEANKFISAIEKTKAEADLQSKLDQIDEAISEVGTNKNGSESLNTKEVDKNNQNNKKITSQQTEEGESKRTTISYRLKNRNDRDLPNPVYTCSGSGKIVINIEVNSLGNVEKYNFNKNASTTTNQCLIDAALKYASQALFTTDASRAKQLGTITFNFPGQ